MTKLYAVTHRSENSIRFFSIVEAYTFNFHVCCLDKLLPLYHCLISGIQYHTLPGTNTVVPIMSLGEDLMRMSLKSSGRVADPAADASRKGKVPTLGEVQKSLKVRSFMILVATVLNEWCLVQQLIKTLIQATSHMESLPSRLF